MICYFSWLYRLGVWLFYWSCLGLYSGSCVHLADWLGASSAETAWMWWRGGCLSSALQIVFRSRLLHTPSSLRAVFEGEEGDCGSYGIFSGLGFGSQITSLLPYSRISLSLLPASRPKKVRSSEASFHSQPLLWPSVIGKIKRLPHFHFLSYPMTSCLWATSQCWSWRPSLWTILLCTINSS